MKATMIEDMIHRAPFKPLELVLDNGSRFKVKHPDFIFLTPNKAGVIIAEGDHVHIIDVDHIANISTRVKGGH